MSYDKLDFLLYRICSGEVELRADGQNYTYLLPSTQTQYRASLIYSSVLSENDELLTRADIYCFLEEMGKWEKTLEDEIVVHIPKVVEDLKIDIYNAYKKDKRYLPTIKEKLEKVKGRLYELLSLKYMFDEYSVESLAEREMNIFLLKKGIKKLMTSPENLLLPLSSSTIQDSEIRKIARSSLWSTKWASLKRGLKVFSKRLTEEQERLVKWSSIYENVQEGEAIPEEILEDDDAFDGYLINRQRQAQRESKLAQLEESLSGKSKGASEVYIPARSFEHAREINALNSPEALRLKEKRFAQILAQGTVKENDMEDQRIKLQLAKNIYATKGQ